MKLFVLFFESYRQSLNKYRGYSFGFDPISLIVSAITAVVSVVVGLISSKNAKSTQLQRSGTQRRESPSRANKSNVKETTSFIPVTFGEITRAGGITNFIQSKTAFTGTETIISNGQSVQQDTEGKNLFLSTVHGWGRIERIDDVFLNGISILDSRFSSTQRVDLTLTWQFNEPAPVQVRIRRPRELSPLQRGFILLRGIDSLRGIELFEEITTTPARYFLFRSNPDGTNERLVLSSPGGLNRFTLQNVGLGTFRYRLEYRDDDGSVFQVGSSIFRTAVDNEDFQIIQNNNLNPSQNSFLLSEFINLRKLEGESVQSANQEWLRRGVPGYTSAYKGNELVRTELILLRHTKGKRADKQPINNIPEVTISGLGLHIYDPRKNSLRTDLNGSGSQREDEPATWQYSNNPILVLRHLLLDDKYGINLRERFNITQALDDKELVKAADYADELIAFNGKSFSRYACNGVYRGGERVVDEFLDVLNSCNAKLFNDNGKSVIKILKPEETSFTFDENNLIGEAEISKGNLKERINTVQVKFINKELNGETDIITISNPDFIAEDGGAVYQSEITLNYTNDYERAFFLGVQTLKQGRLTETIKFTALYSTYSVICGDVVRINKRTGGIIIDKLYRIESVEVLQDFNISYTASEYDADVYTVENIDPRFNNPAPLVENPFDILPPFNLRVTQSFEPDNQGGFEEITTISWNASESTNVDGYKVEFKPFGFGEFEELGSTKQTSFSTARLNPGNYEIRVKAFNTLAESDYSKVEEIEVFEDNTTPPDVQNFTITESSSNVVLNWQLVPQVKNSGFYVIKRFPNAGAEWTDIDEFKTRVAGTQTSITLGQVGGTYLIKAVNSANQSSVNAARVFYDLPDDEELVLVLEVKEEPGFTGVKDRTEVADDILTLQGRVDWDDLENSMDDDTGPDVDDLGGRFTQGSYDFSTLVDLGGVYRFELRKRLDALISDGDRDLDEYDTQNVDDWERATWDSGAPENGEVITGFSTSRDNQEFTDFQELTRNQAGGRFIQFSSTLATDNPDDVLEVYKLGAFIYMKRRQEPGRVFSSSEEAQQVVFRKQFFSIELVTISILNPEPGDIARVVEESRTGFSFEVLDAGGNLTVREVAYVATGVGLRVDS